MAPRKKALSAGAKRVRRRPATAVAKYQTKRGVSAAVSSEKTSLPQAGFDRRTRPRNAYMLFRLHLSASAKVSNAEASKRWAALPKMEKQAWMRKQAEEQQIFWENTKGEKWREHLRGYQRKLLSALEKDSEDGKRRSQEPEQNGAASATSDRPTSEALKLDDFVVENTGVPEAVLGEGSYGTVYRGTHVPTGVTCALKIFRSSDRADVAHERDMYEAMSQAGVTAVPILLAAGPDNPMPFFAMSWGGTSAAQLVRSRPTDRRLHHAIAKQTWRGLIQLHAIGIVHGDFKAGNVVVRAEDVKIMIVDFGFAEFFARVPFTPRHHIYGSEGYRAPEVTFLGRAIDTTSAHLVRPPIDVFAWGCLVGQFVRGSPLFPCDVVEPWRKALRRWTESAGLRQGSVQRWVCRNDFASLWSASLSAKERENFGTSDLAPVLLKALDPCPTTRLRLAGP